MKMQNVNRPNSQFSNYYENQSNSNGIYDKYSYQSSGYDYDYSSNQSPCPSSTSSTKVRRKAKRNYYQSDDESDVEVRKKPRNGLLNETSGEEVDTIEHVLDTRLGPPGETGDETTIYNVLYNTTSSTQGSERQYLIKWKNWSHVHATWESEDSLKARGHVEGTKKLEKYIAKLRESERYKNSCSRDELERILFSEEQIRDLSYQKMRIDRIIHHQYDKGGNLEYFIKWKSLDYRYVSAESAETVVAPLFKQAIADYKERLNNDANPDINHQLLRQRPTYQPIPKGVAFGAEENLYLRDYQEIGVNWLLNLWTKGRNALLADEMGLGKTIQTVAFINILFRRYKIYGPYLLIVPLSTIDNWKKEFDIWAPEIYTVVYTGDIASRDVIRKYEWFVPTTKNLKFNVILTTYEIVMNDKNLLNSIYWVFLGVDEAHRLKSCESKLYKTIYPFRTNCRLLITGTPLQNNIKELWALLHFIMPNVFNVFENFEKDFGTAENERLCKDKLSNLRETIEPYILRREKKDVEKSLPAKSEQMLRIGMSQKQKELYRLILAKNFESLHAETNRRTIFNNVIVELKKCCNHVDLISEKLRTFASIAERQDYLIKSSGKMIVLDKLLLYLKSENHRVLIFSQMVRMLDILDEYLRIRSWGFQRLDGSVSSANRNEAIKNFNAPGSKDFCFLLSTRAGGLGINLTSADTVIIFDSDWNPHADLQAMARAHRIGQTKQVSIYRFVIKNSVEEKIIERAKHKMVLDHLIIQRMEANGVSSKGSKPRLEAEDFDAILRFSAQEIFKDDDEETDFNLQTILKQAEVQDTSNATSAFLSSFKVISLDTENLDAPAEIATEAEAKTWNDLIPKKYLDALNKSHGNIGAIVDFVPKKESVDLPNKLEPKSTMNSTNNHHTVAKLNRVETRKLVNTMMKFGCPHKRVDKILKDTQLTKLDENQLCHVIIEILDGCKKILSENYDGEDLNNVTFDYNGYNVPCKMLLTKVEMLNELHMVMTQYSDDERFTNQFVKETKPTAWPCDWNSEDDNHLLIGVFEHGMGSWKEIKVDPRLKLKHKILRSDKGTLPQEKHLSTRVHYLLDCLSKCKAPIKLKIKLGVSQNRPSSIEQHQCKSDNSNKSFHQTQSEPIKRPSHIGVQQQKQRHQHKTDSSDTDSSLSSISHTSSRSQPLDDCLDDFCDNEFSSCSGEMFKECKQHMKECRKELSAFQKILTTEQPVDHRYLDPNIIRIGNRINFVVQNAELHNRRVYFKYLWQFVKIFCPGYSATDIYDIYRKAMSNEDK